MIYTGTTSFLPDYVVGVSIINGNGTINAVAEINPANQSSWNYKAPGFSGSFNFETGSYYFTDNSSGTNTIVFHFTAVSTEVVRPEPSFVVKSSGAVAYLARAEDEEDQDLDDEVYDDYPWRQSIVGGGDLVELDTYITSSPDVAIDVVSRNTAVQAHTGVDIQVVGIPSPATGRLRLMFQPYSTASDYAPNQLSIGYVGQFKDLSTLTQEDIDLINDENDLETLFEAGYSIYRIGLAQEVLVADLPKFFSPPHRFGMVGWLPFNEHPEDDLTVIDHSSINGAPTLLNIDPADRTWSDERGWYLSLPAFGTVLSDGYRSICNEQSMSFWINPSAQTSNGTTTIVQLGPLSFDLNNGASTISAYVGTFATNGPVRDLIDTQSVAANAWSFFYIRKNSGTATYGWGANLQTSASETTITTIGTYTPADTTDTRVTVASGTLPFGIHDLRIWDKFKSQSDMDLIRYHHPTPTQTTYRLGFIDTVDKGDRYGLRVLPNGFVTTDVMPAWLRSVEMGLVRRYDSTGAYSGEDRFKEVGVGGGRPLPATYHLGNQFTVLTAAGTSVIAPAEGFLPGYNKMWLNDSSAGTYAVLEGGTITGSGTTATYVWDGTAAPVPSFMVETNPNVDFVWIYGDDKFVHEVYLYGSLMNTQLVSRVVSRDRSDAELEINKILQVFESTGSVYAVTAQGTIYPNELLVTSTGGTIISVGTVAATGAVTVITAGTAEVSILHPETLRMAELPTGARTILAANVVFPLAQTVVTVEGGGMGLTIEVTNFSGVTLYGSNFEFNNGHGPVFGSHPVPTGSVDFRILSASVGSTDPWTLTYFGSIIASNSVYNQTLDVVYFAFAPDFLELAVNATGSVYVKPSSGTLSTPPLYLYLNERIVADAPNAWDTWTDNTNTGNFGNEQNPPVAALNDNGLLEFENTGTLAAGNFELEVISANIGNPDPDFHGFDVQVTINTSVFSGVLLANETGYNVTGTDTFRFPIANSVFDGNWLISFNWTNAYSNPDTGQARQLAILGYQLRRLGTELWEVQISGSQPTSPQLTQLLAPPLPTPPTPFVENSYILIPDDSVPLLGTQNGACASVPLQLLFTTDGAQVRSSPDGVTWTALGSTTGNSMLWINYGNGLLVEVGNGGNIWNSVDNGNTWNQQTSPTANELSYVAYLNGLWIAVGNMTAIVTSPDGFTWTDRSLGGGTFLFKVAYGNGLYVTIDNGANIYTSPDGATWTTRTSNVVGNLFGVAFGNGVYVAVGSSNTDTPIATMSTDGITWTPISAPGPVEWEDVSFGNGNFIAVDDNDNAWKSTDGVTWTLDQVLPVTPGDLPVYIFYYQNGIFGVVDFT